jgi:hypothetical protein
MLLNFDGRSLTCVFVCTEMCFRFSNPVPMADSYVVLTELEERRVGSILGYRTSSIEEF